MYKIQKKETETSNERATALFSFIKQNFFYSLSLKASCFVCHGRSKNSNKYTTVFSFVKKFFKIYLYSYTYGTR